MLNISGLTEGIVLDHIPVSYTHLDVYKRQPLYIVKSTPFKAYTFVSPTRYTLYKFLTCMAGILSFICSLPISSKSVPPVLFCSRLQFSLRLNRNK